MIKLTELLVEEKLRYGCVMLYFDFSEFENIQNKIKKDDLYVEEEDRTFGLEDEPHITLLYGLHNEINLDDIKKVLNKHTYEKCTFHNISLFENEKYDVLKFDVKGSQLKETNQNLKQYPYTSDFDEYHPHSTIAYLKSGFGKKYVNMFKDLQYTKYPKYAMYSEADHTKTKIEIKTKNK